jgi:predicted DNA-binding WGR domain protein
VARTSYPRSPAQGIDIQWRNRGVAGLCCNARRKANKLSLNNRPKKAARHWPAAPASRPTLFGEWALVREWGRRGSSGTVRLSSYQRRDEAETAERHTIKRLQHGYRDAV